MSRWGARIEYSLKKFNVGMDWHRVVSERKAKKVVLEWRRYEVFICWGRGHVQRTTEEANDRGERPGGGSTVRAKETIRGDCRQERGWFFLSQGKRSSGRSRLAFQWGVCSHTIEGNDFCKCGHLEAKTIRRELSWPGGHRENVGVEMQGGSESMASQGVLACERGGWNQTKVAWENEDGLRG